MKLARPQAVRAPPAASIKGRQDSSLAQGGNLDVGGGRQLPSLGVQKYFVFKRETVAHLTYGPSKVHPGSSYGPSMAFLWSSQSKKHVPPQTVQAFDARTIVEP